MTTVHTGQSAGRQGRDTTGPAIIRCAHCTYSQADEAMWWNKNFRRHGGGGVHSVASWSCREDKLRHDIS